MVKCLLQCGMQMGQGLGMGQSCAKSSVPRDELAWEGPGKAGHSIYTSRVEKAPKHVEIGMSHQQAMQGKWSFSRIQSEQKGNKKLW